SLYISVTIYLPIFLVTTITTVYSVAALKQIMGGRKWSLWRVSSFWSGAALMLVAFSPLHHAHSHHLFYHHMTQHLLIGMLAPVFLVMAAPVSLALRILPSRIAKICIRVLHSKIMQIWCHPVAALIFNF